MYVYNYPPTAQDLHFDTIVSEWKGGGISHTSLIIIAFDYADYHNVILRRAALDSLVTDLEFEPECFTVYELRVILDYVDPCAVWQETDTANYHLLKELEARARLALDKLEIAAEFFGGVS